MIPDVTGPPAAGTVGVISDTHGLVRPEALAALEGCVAILHAGDVGGPEVLEALERIAPVTAVRGNADVGPWAGSLPERVVAHAAGLSVLIIHDLQDLRGEARPPDVGVIVSGHSHLPRVHERNGVLHVNPGSAGPRRFRLPVTLALLRTDHGAPAAELVRLVR